MGLLDLFGGDSTQPGALYGGLLSPQQSSALGYRGLLAAAGALGQAAMPSRLPIPIGAALGSAAGAMGQAQDEAALNAMKGQLVGLQGQSLASDLAIRKQLAGILPGLAGAGGAGTGASPTGGGEVGSPAPNASVNDNSGIGAGQLYSYLSSIGASPNEAALLTSGANVESSFKPDTTHDAAFLATKGLPPGYGLWGDNADRLANMRASAGVGPTANVPWQDQAKFQLAELRGQMGDRVNAAKTPEQLTALQLEYLRPKGWNTGGGAAAQRLAATREYMATPPGAKPTQIAQANTGTVSDAVPQPPGAPQSLLPPPAPGSDTLRVGGAGGLLTPPQPTATPFTNAPPINGVGAPAPGPQGGLLAPQAPQVAQAAPRPPMAPGAPGMGIGLPPVPNIDPRALAAASSLAQLGHMGDVFGPLEKYYYQSPGYLAQAGQAKALGEGAGQLPYAGPLAGAKAEAENASKLRFAQPIATAEALGKMPFTSVRPNASFPQVAANGQITGWTQAPAAPEHITQYDPTTGMGYPGSFTPQSPFGRGVPNLGGNAQPNGGAPPAPQSQMPTALGPGVTTSMEGRAKAEQESRQQTIEAGAAAQQQQSTLLSMKAAVPNFYTGPFSEHINDAKTILMMLPGGDKYADSVANFNDFAKNAGFLTRQAVRDTSPRAAVQEFKLIGGALPNNEIPEQGGLNRVLNEYMGLNDYRIAKTQAQNMWEIQHGGPGQVAGFETDWQSKVSPYAFVMMRMDPADRQKLIAQVGSTKQGQAELQHLGQQVQYIQQSGLEQFIR